MAKCINRDDVLEQIMLAETRENMFRRIMELPATDVVERKTGTWVFSEIQRPEDIKNDNYQYCCSNCGRRDLHAKGMTVPYCWNCGAKMSGGDDYV